MPRATRKTIEKSNLPSDGRLVSAHQLNVWQKLCNHISGSIVLNFKNGPSRDELRDWEKRAAMLVQEMRDVLK